MGFTMAGWALFGAAVRWVQLGIEMRPFFARESNLYTYPLYAGVAMYFGHWLDEAEARQIEDLMERRDRIIARRALWMAKEKELAEKGYGPVPVTR